jgi:hypothetical protein
MSTNLRLRRRPRPRLGFVAPSIFEESVDPVSVNTPVVVISVRARTSLFEDEDEDDDEYECEDDQDIRRPRDIRFSAKSDQEMSQQRLPVTSRRSHQAHEVAPGDAIRSREVGAKGIKDMGESRRRERSREWPKFFILPSPCDVSSLARAV